MLTNIPNGIEMKILLRACECGDVNTVRNLIRKKYLVNLISDEGKSILSIVCGEGYYELALLLLESKANVESRCLESGCTPLMECALADHVEIIRLLLNYNANVNAKSKNGITPLMFACGAGHIDCVLELIANGANVNHKNNTGYSCLMVATDEGHLSVVKALLENEANTETYSFEFNESALTLACLKGHLDIVNVLLTHEANREYLPPKTEIKEIEMSEALSNTAVNGYLEIAMLLLKFGAKINNQSKYFESPLTLAALGGHMDYTIFSINEGLDVDLVNFYGYTPLMKAAVQDHVYIMKLLIDKGANVNALNVKTNETALTLACAVGKLYTVDFLIRHGADLELGEVNPLMVAAREGYIHLVIYILQCGANLNAKTSSAETALFFACQNGHVNIVNLLLEYGADLEHECKYGNTVLLKTCIAGHLSTVQLLISKNANVNKINHINKHTPLSLAIMEGHFPIVKLLLENYADLFYKLSDDSTMVLLAAKCGHINIVKLLLVYLATITNVSDALCPFVIDPNGENFSRLNDAELVNTTIKMCEELISKRKKKLPFTNESMINRLVHEHLSKVRRFNRIVRHRNYMLQK